MLLPHNEFDVVFNECKKMLKEFGLPTKDNGYYFDSASVSHIDVILNLEPVDYYRLMMRESLMELDMLRLKNKQQDRVIDEIVTSRSWKITRPLRWAVEKKKQFLK